MDSELQLISPDQVAEMLGVSKRALLELPIRRVTLGHRTVRFHPADIKAFIDDTRQRYVAEDEGT